MFVLVHYLVIIHLSLYANKKETPFFPDIQISRESIMQK